MRNGYIEPGDIMRAYWTDTHKELVMLNNTIDISHHQTLHSATDIKGDGIQFALLKATEGCDYTDPRYIAYRSALENAGICCGAYHFGTGSDAAQQAVDFLNATKTLEAPSLLALDFESNPSRTTMTVPQANTFVKTIYERTGRYPGLYVSTETIKKLRDWHQNATEHLYRCWLWVAQWGDEPNAAAISPWSHWTLWQYTDGGHGREPHAVSGIGTCDRDKFYGTEDQFQAFIKPRPNTP